MPICKNCNLKFPNSKLIDGKRRSLQSRKYCLDCSPFAAGNRKKLESTKEREWISSQPCNKCGSVKNKKPLRCKQCYSCVNKANEVAKGDRLYQLTGDNCWNCGYGKGKEGRPILDFHHLGNKEFGLTIRNIGNSRWEKVIQEARKCVLLCCRCHREVHLGFISMNEVENLHRQRWNEIQALSSVG